MHLSLCSLDGVPDTMGRAHDGIPKVTHGRLAELRMPPRWVTGGGVPQRRQNQSSNSQEPTQRAIQQWKQKTTTRSSAELTILLET